MMNHDLRFPLCRSMIVSGPSCCGKICYVTTLIQGSQQLFTPTPKRILWYYGEIAPHPALKGVEYKRGLPTEEEVELFRKCIVVLDDLMWESSSSHVVGNLFTRVAHHRECFIIHITQNLFQWGTVTHMLSMNAHYLVLFKNPRDHQQILHLALQIYPRQEVFVLDCFEDATRRNYGYLLVDLNPITPEEMRLRTENEDKQTYAYVCNL